MVLSYCKNALASRQGEPAHLGGSLRHLDIINIYYMCILMQEGRVEVEKNRGTVPLYIHSHTCYG